MNPEAPILPLEMRPSAASSKGTADEGTMLASYLLGGRDAPSEAVERYAHACDAVFNSAATTQDLALFRFVRRRPWSLPFLDAATALVDRHALLRKKLFLMLAILETMPDNVEIFTPKPSPRWRVILRLARWGAACALKAVAGLVLYPLARRAR